MFNASSRLLILFFFLFAACDKRMAIVPNPPVINPSFKTRVSLPFPDKQVKSSIQGIIRDENNKPLQGAQVKCGSIKTITDIYGSFLLENVFMVEAAAVVTVQKEGYFTGIRTFMVSDASKLQYVQVQLLPKKIVATFDAATGGNISTTNAQFIFQPQPVLNAENKPYTGKVFLVYAHIHPESPDFSDRMPGDLRGVNDSNKLVGLQSYGMMAVELQGERGETLHLDTTKSVILKLIIPSSIRASAPSTIPLWYFEEATGMWREEGSATKMGDTYVGTIKHFSFWNFDVPFPLISIKAIFQDAQNTPLANVAVRIQRNNGSYGYGYTNEAGEVKCAVPLGEPLQLQLVNRCNTFIVSKNIGPFTNNNNTNLGIIKVTVPAATNLQISGTVSNCNGSPATSGIVKISIDGILYQAPVNNGPFKASIIRCQQEGSTAIIFAIDSSTNKMSTMTMPITSSSYQVNLTACDAIQSAYISSSLNGQAINFSTPDDSVNLKRRNFSYLFFANSYSNYDYINFTMDTISKGTYVLKEISVSFNNEYYIGSGTYTITQTGTIGNYLLGTFNAKVVKRTDSSLTKPFSGSFKALIRE